MVLCCSHPTSWPQNNPTNRLSVEEMVRWGVREMPVSTLLEQGCFFFVLGALGVQELNEGEGWCFHISRIEGAVVTIS